MQDFSRKLPFSADFVRYAITLSGSRYVHCLSVWAGLRVRWFLCLHGSRLLSVTTLRSLHTALYGGRATRRCIRFKLNEQHNL